MTGAYLDEHRSPRPGGQFREPRREQWCGVLPDHTSEGVKDDVGPDTGTINLAGFISRRLDPGSYHRVFDSDDALQLVRDSCEAYSVAADSWNQWTINFSFCCRTTDLHPSDGWTHAAYRLAGIDTVQVFTDHGFCPECSARWITRTEAFALRARAQWCRHGLRLGGLLNHGDLQPGDRSDAIARHPFRAELEQLRLDYIAAARGDTPDTPTASEEEPEMNVSQIAHDVSTGQLWHVWGPAGQMPYDLGYIRDPSDIATLTTLYGATPIQGDQSALVSLLLEQTQKDRPGQGEGLTLADLAAQRDQIVAGVQYILEMDGRDHADAEAFAAEVVDAMAKRLES